MSAVLKTSRCFLKSVIVCTSSQETYRIGLWYGTTLYTCEILADDWLLLAQINVKIHLD